MSEAQIFALAIYMALSVCGGFLLGYKFSRNPVSIVVVQAVIAGALFPFFLPLIFPGGV